jgi:hypothetical protein
MPFFFNRQRLSAPTMTRLGNMLIIRKLLFVVIAWEELLQACIPGQPRAIRRGPRAPGIALTCLQADTIGGWRRGG